MAVRATCSDLIRRLRDLIGDAAKTTWVTDDALQDALDDNQMAQRYIPLVEQETRTPGGWVYLDFYTVDLKNWEADAVTVDGNYATLVPTLADLVNGHWAYAAQPAFPVYATGKTYDLYGAAADLLEKEAGQVRRSFDLTEDGGATMRRSQMSKMMLDLAGEYRAKQAPLSIGAGRSDAGDGGESPARWAGRGGWLPVSNPNA